MSTNQHDEWFKQFARAYPDGEVLEDIIEAEGLPQTFRNADFFFERRKFIGELKTLEASRLPKIEAVIEELREKGELPIYYHPAPVSIVIKDHPQRQKLNSQFLKEVAKTLSHDFREVNAQIRETKEAFKLPSARGFIIATNSVVSETTPMIAQHELKRLLMKKKGGKLLYPEIDFAIYIQTVEVNELDNNHAFIPCLTVTRQDDDDISAFSTSFLKGFASINGWAFYELEGDASPILEKTVPHKRFRMMTQRQPLTRSQLWRHQYRANRVYSQLSEEDLIEKLARFMLEELLVLNNGKIGPSTVPNKREYLGERLEHLFTECELRYIDMRLIPRKIETLLQHRSVTGEVAEFLMQRT